MISVGSVVRVYPGPPRFAFALLSASGDFGRSGWICGLSVDGSLGYSLEVQPEWGCSSAGRAPALQAGGQRFDPAQLHQGFGVDARRRPCL